MRIASSGEKPASTSKLDLALVAEARQHPPLPVGSGPASSNPPAATNARSSPNSLAHALACAAARSGGGSG